MEFIFSYDLLVLLYFFGTRWKRPFLAMLEQLDFEFEECVEERNDERLFRWTERIEIG